MIDVSSVTPVINEAIAVTKRGRGRPPKAKVEGGEERVKKARGRPRKEIDPSEVKETVKRARGRPRKYSILGKEQMANGEMKPVIKKVESGFLLKHMFEYFTKLMILHAELSKEAGKNEVIFKRLKVLDFQMAEVCKSILSTEYQQGLVENNVDVSLS
jgi:hypothetical protein